MENIDLYFNEAAHTYVDNRGFKYTSMTTVIGKYEEKFDTKVKAVGVTRKKASQYYGWTPAKVIKHWEELNRKSLIKGNRVHNWLEDSVKKASGYNLIDNTYINDKIYTVNTMDFNKGVGQLDLDFFVRIGVADKYPRIFRVIELLVSQGYLIFSEIGIFDPEKLVSGLIDVLFMNPTTKRFIILDWKTNKHELIPFQDETYKWISGYFKKDKFGNITRKFIQTNQFFKAPLNKYQQSHYMIYALQLSGYAHLVEKLGYTLDSIILAHIREEHTYNSEDIEVSRMPNLLGKTRTDLVPINYLKNDVEAMFQHHFENTTENLQATLIQ